MAINLVFHGYYYNSSYFYYYTLFSSLAMYFKMAKRRKNAKSPDWHAFRLQIERLGASSIEPSSLLQFSRQYSPL